MHGDEDMNHKTGDKTCLKHVTHEGLRLSTPGRINYKQHYRGEGGCKRLSDDLPGGRPGENLYLSRCISYDVLWSWISPFFTKSHHLEDRAALLRG